MDRSINIKENSGDDNEIIILLFGDILLWSGPCLWLPDGCETSAVEY